MKTNNPRYSIIIPTWNHLDDCLRPCLESIFFYTDFSKKDIEIVVVANGCEDDTVPYLQGLNNESIVILESKKPLGYTRATNFGIKASRGEFVILMNNDVLLLGQEKSTWLREMEKPFEDTQMGITGVHTLTCPQTGRDFLLFYLVMIRRELFNKIGLLDEIFNPGAGEDTDYCHRAEDAGYKIKMICDQVYAPEANIYTTSFPVYHRAEATVHDLPDWNIIFARNGGILQERYRKK